MTGLLGISELPWKVYGLVEQQSRFIYYVGIARNVKIRISQHRSDPSSSVYLHCNAEQAEGAGMTETDVLLAILVVLSLTTGTGWAAAAWLFVSQRKRIIAMDDDIARIDSDVGELWQEAYPMRHPPQDGLQGHVVPFRR